MVATYFKCNKCGYCCRTLLGTAKGFVEGLSLTKKETILFDQKFIFPQRAFGVDKPTYIFQYQLSLAVCPHITEKNECAIYENRPMICRCYPFEMIGNNCIISKECPEINRITKEKIPTVTPPECEEMYDYFIRQKIEHCTKSSNLWYFDLTRKRWLGRQL
jgi:Fe-S-cluster containining protein